MDLISILRLTPISISNPTRQGSVHPHSPGPLRSGRRFPRPEPNSDEALNAKATDPCQRTAVPHGAHTVDAGRAPAPVHRCQEVGADRLGAMRAPCARGQGRVGRPSILPRDGPERVRRAAPTRRDSCCGQELPRVRHDLTEGTWLEMLSRQV